MVCVYGWFPKIMVPQNGCAFFMVPNPMNKWMIWGTIILGNTHIDHSEITFRCNLPLNKDLDRLLSVRIPKRLLDEATTTGGGWETGGKARGGCNGLTSGGSLKWQVDGLIAGSFMIFFSASCIENSYLRSN